ALTLALVLIAAYPLGAFMADVFENRRTFLTPVIGPVERGLYRMAGVDPEAEQEWFEYAISMVAFGGACMLSLYACCDCRPICRSIRRAFRACRPTLPSTSQSASSPTQTGRLTPARRRSATFRRWSA